MPSNLIIDLRPSSTLAYVVGVVLGDGSIWHPRPHEYTIGLRVKDEEFASAFLYALQHIGLGAKTMWCSQEAGREYHVVRARGKALYTYLRPMKDDPSCATEIALQYPRDFLRGMYDSEGSLHTDSTRYGYRHIQLPSTDRRILEVCGACLDSLEIPYYFYTYGRKPNSFNPHPFVVHKLALNRQCAIDRFLLEVGSSIPRKRGGT